MTSPRALPRRPPARAHQIAASAGRARPPGAKAARPAPSPPSDELLRRAQEKFDLGETEAALTLARQAAGAGARAAAHVLMGKVMMSERRFDEAEREFAEAVRLDPGRCEGGAAARAGARNAKRRSMTTDAQDLFVKGQRIDRYEIREHIGQGGMGTVYRAVDTKLGRIVALKTVVAHKRGDKLTEEIRERFMREALAASRVDHRNVVQVLDFGFADDGTPYMVMEYLRGRSLSAILKGASAPLAIDYVADVLLSVCAALRACHHVGIIHRDLKPANIYLCDTDTGWEVKVLDFGISKAPAADELTQDGQIIGTPQYLSPEQIEGTVGNESDQYALGVLLYVCLTQRLPYANFHGVRLLRAIAEGQVQIRRAHCGRICPRRWKPSCCAPCTSSQSNASIRSTRWASGCGSSPARAARRSGRRSTSTPRRRRNR